MSEIFHNYNETQYYVWDRFTYVTQEECLADYEKSTVLYVGNVNKTTSDDQIYSTFSVVGPVRRVIMGKKKETNEPCGFCFVEYYDRASCLAALCSLHETVLDGNIIKLDLDGGYKPDREYGRIDREAYKKQMEEMRHRERRNRHFHNDNYQSNNQHRQVQNSRGDESNDEELPRKRRLDA